MNREEEIKKDISITEAEVACLYKEIAGYSLLAESNYGIIFSKPELQKMVILRRDHRKAQLDSTLELLNFLKDLLSKETTE